MPFAQAATEHGPDAPVFSGGRNVANPPTVGVPTTQSLDGSIQKDLDLQDPYRVNSGRRSQKNTIGGKGWPSARSAYQSASYRTGSSARVATGSRNPRTRLGSQRSVPTLFPTLTRQSATKSGQRNYGYGYDLHSSAPKQAA